METHFEFGNSNGSPRKVIQDVRVLIQDVESLVKGAGLRWGARSREDIDHALEKMTEAKKRLEKQARKTLDNTADMVRKHPYESMGVAFGVGMILGLILGRK